MNCNRAEDLFSDRYDDRLASDARQALEQHLAACPACRAGYGSFAAAVGRLRALEVPALPPAYAARVSAAVFAERAPPVVVARRAWRRPTLWILSHAAALLLGWGLVRFGGESQSGDGKPEALARVVPPAPRIVEVPVEKRVEVRVEVPVEVVKEVIVERIEYVDRPVPHPLQLPLDRGQALAAELVGSLRELARLASRRAESDATVHAEPRAPAVELPVPALASGNATRAPMVVLREDGCVRIRTCGAAADVVPALIAVLDDPDRELAAAAERHLSSIRSSLAREQGGDPGSQPAAVAAAPVEEGGIRAWWSNLGGAPREEPASQATPREHWQAWWNARSVASADARAH